MDLDKKLEQTFMALGKSIELRLMDLGVENMTSYNVFGKQIGKTLTNLKSKQGSH